MAAAVQGSAAQLIDLTIGSVLRAILESSAGVALWLQWLILQVLSMTRASTSSGTDLDTWMADFSFYRLQGAAASGLATFARYTAGQVATVPVGTQLMTSDNSQRFSVIVDSSNTFWTGANAYSIPATILLADLPVQCNSVGISGNVQAGTLTQIASPIIGVDTVTNAAPFFNGINSESDASFRARFQLYINSLSLCTVEAIEAALAAIQIAQRYLVLENMSSTGTFQPGNFVVVADDGTGVANPLLLADATTAVNSNRPIGSTYFVTAPLAIYASVNMSIVTTNAATHASVCSAIAANIQSWIADLPIAGTLAISKLDAIAHDTDPSVVSVTLTQINGASTDLVAATIEVILAGSITVS